MLGRSQVDRLGERLKSGIATEADLTNLEAYRRLAGPVYSTVVKGIQSLGLEVTGRPSKSTRSIVEKLKRESCRLSQIQDIAGCRIVVNGFKQQESVTKEISLKLLGLRLIDRRKVPSFGYRAVHLVHRAGPIPIEIQVRSIAQHAWAEVSEKLSDRLGVELKYGGGPDNIREFLMKTSKLIHNIELSEEQLVELEKAGEDLSNKFAIHPYKAFVPKIEEVVEALNKRNSEHQARCDSMREELLSYLTDFLRILD